jgi:Tol biopolymer transport system component
VVGSNIAGLLEFRHRRVHHALVHPVTFRPICNGKRGEMFRLGIKKGYVSWLYALLAAGTLLWGQGCEPTGPVSNSGSIGTIAYNDSLDYLHLIGDDGRGDRQIGTQEFIAPKWSLDGTLLSAYQPVATLDTGLVLVVIDPATGQSRRVSAVLEGQRGKWVTIWQSWSPDGRYIAFSSPKGGTQQRIFVAEVQTGQEWTVGVQGASTPTWQPTGNQIAYSPYAGSFRIVQMDGTQDVQFYSGICCAGYPHWSPGGDLLAFLVSETSSSTTVHAYIGVVSTREVRPLGSPVGFFPEGWSPDGTRLLLSNQSRLALIDSKGGDIRWLTDGLSNEGIRHVGHASWSPRGDKVALVSIRGTPSERYDLWVVNLDGSGAKRIAEKCGSEFSWSPK